MSTPLPRRTRNMSVCGRILLAQRMYAQPGCLRARDFEKARLHCSFLPNHISWRTESARKKTRRVARENGAPFRIAQLRALQDPLIGIDGQVPAQIWKICAVQNLIDSRHVAQHTKNGITCRKRRVPINSAEHVRVLARASQSGRIKIEGR